MPLAKVIAERPDVFNHNVEVVPRLYPVARRGSTLGALAARAAQRQGDGRRRGRHQVRPDGRARRDARGDGRGVRPPARAGRPGAHRRPVPAPHRAPPAGRALLAPRRVQGARAAPPTTSASSTSPPARSCARATTRTSTSSRISRASARSPRRSLWRVLRRGLPKPSDDDERRVVANIREHGWHAMHVRDEFHPEHAGLAQPDQDPAVAAAGAEGFSYTVGLWAEHHHPELVITRRLGPLGADARDPRRGRDPDPRRRRALRRRRRGRPWSS